MIPINLSDLTPLYSGIHRLRNCREPIARIQAETAKRPKQDYVAEETRKAEIRKAQQASFEQILVNAPATFIALQLGYFLMPLVNLDLMTSPRT
jgi:hypothetical protein